MKNIKYQKRVRKELLFNNHLFSPKRNEQIHKKDILVHYIAMHTLKVLQK